MAITFTIYMLWYAAVPGVHGGFVFIALGADLINYTLKKVIGLGGEK